MEVDVGCKVYFEIIREFIFPCHCVKIAQKSLSPPGLHAEAQNDSEGS
jgi:hypothetical protein